MDKLLVSVEEAADLLGVGRSTVYDLMRTGELSSVLVRRCRRITMDALRAYLRTLESQTGNYGDHLRRSA